jgi:hypothetical protein
MISLNKTLLATAAALALLVVGCGGDDSESASTETTGKQANKQKKDSDEKASNGEEKKKDDPRACGKLQITPETDKEGSCNREQGRFIFVNRGSTLELSDLDLEVDRVREASQVSGPAGVVKPDKGKTFVLVTMTWKNKDSRSRDLNESKKQVRLRMKKAGGAPFQKAEQTYPNSLFNEEKIKPDKQQRVTAIFQIPESAAEGLKLRGAAPHILVWTFKTANDKKAAPSGGIRLWTS